MITLTESNARAADATTLATLMCATRDRTLRLLKAWQRALPDLRVPYSTDLNPPLWELGHIGWFQEWWVGRNDLRRSGIAADPDRARPPSRLPNADVLYDSSLVPHATRWGLPLPDLDATLRYLEAVLDDTLTLLQKADADDAALYFFRLALFHEDMHNEASIYMAQTLGIEIPPDIAIGHPAFHATGAVDPEIRLTARGWSLGYAGTGFAFDNELACKDVELDSCHIDALPVTWARYLPFVEATGHRLPLHVRKSHAGWEQRRFGKWHALDRDAAAVHISWDDAAAWCDWAGRRLPTEAEWGCAAVTHPGFAWGEVWEWTMDVFNPYPGFVAHPYRDYSVPWFGSRRVLRGASTATASQMAHPCYRNFFTPERRDIFAGFRSVRCDLPN